MLPKIDGRRNLSIITSKAKGKMVGLACSWHGSEFDLEGNPLAGPARGVLLHFAVQIDASGNITIDVDQRVDASVRTPVT